MREASSSSWLKRAWQVAFAHEPMRLARWEMVVMRFGLAMVTWSSLRFLPSPLHSQPVPHGMAAWGVDFTWLSNPQLCSWFVPLCGVSLILYVIGIWPALTLVPPLVAIIGQGVLSNSQGAIHHTSQVIAMALLAGWLAAMWSILAKRSHRPLPHGLNAPQLEMDWMRQLLMAGYVVSAVMKLMESGGNWLGETPYFGLQIEKSTGMAFHAHLEPPANAAWLAQYFIDHPLIAKITIGLGLPLELFAFAALLNRRSALFFGAALYAFHFIITQVMNLGFAYNRMLLLFLFINPLWWVVWLIRGLRGRYSRPTV
jgi:hypothetical protein